MWPNGNVSPLRGAKMLKEKEVRNVSNRARKTEEIEISCQNTLLHRCEVHFATEILECGPQNLKKRPNKDVKKGARVGPATLVLLTCLQQQDAQWIPKSKNGANPWGPGRALPGYIYIYIYIYIFMHGALNIQAV